ncbi:MAG: RHS repeat domain-containing protein, partial [Sphingomonadaceae bacterium]
MAQRNIVPALLASAATARAVTAIAAAAALAGETQGYVYDARGRLIEVTRSGGPADGVASSYAYDKANNRTSHAVSGGATPPPPSPPPS